MAAVRESAPATGEKPVRAPDGDEDPREASTSRDLRPKENTTGGTVPAIEILETLHFWRVEVGCLKHRIFFVNTAVAVAFAFAFAATATVRFQADLGTFTSHVHGHLVAWQLDCRCTQPGLYLAELPLAAAPQHLDRVLQSTTTILDRSPLPVSTPHDDQQCRPSALLALPTQPVLRCHQPELDRSRPSSLAHPRSQTCAAKWSCRNLVHQR